MKISNQFDKKRGDRIDKVLFMRDIIGYLDQDVDKRQRE